MHVYCVTHSSLFSLKETLWKKEVHDSIELRQVTCAVAYDIQGAHHLVCAYVTSMGTSVLTVDFACVGVFEGA